MSRMYWILYDMSVADTEVREVDWQVNEILFTE